jgi:FkbM family methyltransferase
MPTIRQSLVASLTRHYPLYSGCGTFANKRFIQNIAGNSTESVWARVPGGEILAPLDDYVGRAAFYVGDLDRKLTWICEKIVRPGDTVLDIGANIGIVTLLLSKLVGKNGMVHSFEPNPDLQKLLHESFNHNQISNVRLHPIALGSEQCSLELRIPRVNAGAASLIRNRGLSDCNVFEVPVRRLSSIVTEEGIESIRLIKIDVEGFEADVLKGGEDVLKSIRPEAILFETDENADGTALEQPVIKLLHNFGYGFFSLPRCLLRMRLRRFDPNKSNQIIGHDFLAVPKGEAYENIAKLVNASG